MSVPRRGASPLARALTEEDLERVNRQHSPDSSPSPLGHQRNRHLSGTGSHTSSQEETGKQYPEMVHENMEEEDYQRGAPPPSPRPPQLTFDDDDDDDMEARNRVPPPTPRLGKRFIFASDPEDSDEEEEETNEVDPTPPGRSPSRMSMSRSFSRPLPRPRARPLLTRSRSFSFPNKPMRDAQPSNDYEEEEAEVRKYLYQDEDGDANMDTQHNQDDSGSPGSSISSSPVSTYSEIAMLNMDPPTFPTPTDFDRIPSILDESVSTFNKLAEFILNCAESSWDEASRAGASELLLDWSLLLGPLKGLHTHIPEPIPADPAYHAPRYGDLTYAFTRTTVDTAYVFHGDVYTRLMDFITGHEQATAAEIEGILDEIKEENEKHWGHIQTAWESDKANEVKGESWCYGKTDWSAPDNPRPEGWAGGGEMVEMEVATWPAVAALQRRKKEEEALRRRRKEEEEEERQREKQSFLETVMKESKYQ